MVLVLIDQKTNKPDHLEKWLSANDWFVLKVGALNSAWRKNMTQNNFISWWSEKNKALYEKLSANTVVDTPVNIAYRKILNNVRIRYFFKKCSMSSYPCQL